MSYELLSKLKYKDPKHYEAIYQERLHSPYTVRTDFKVKGSPAFFVQTPEVFELTYKLLSLDKAVLMTSDSLPMTAIAQYADSCLIDEIVSSNSIEGVHSTRREIGEVLRSLEEQSKTKGKLARFQGIVHKYKVLLDPEEVPLKTLENIRAVYDEIVLKEVLEEDPNNMPDGKLFRKESASVYDEAQREIHRGLYPESSIVSGMENALSFLNDSEVNVLYRACCFHYMFEYIHPFYDGNGRLGRYILSDILSSELHYLLSLSISTNFKTHLHEYYQAFKDCNDETNLGDMTPFLIMVLKVLCDAEEALLEDLTKKEQTWQRYRRIVSQSGFDEPTRELVESLLEATLFTRTGITRNALMDTLQISSTTLKKRIEKLKKMSLLQERKEGRYLFYKLDLDQFSDSMTF